MPQSSQEALCHSLLRRPAGLAKKREVMFIAFDGVLIQQQHSGPTLSQAPLKRGSGREFCAILLCQFRDFAVILGS